MLKIRNLLVFLLAPIAAITACTSSDDPAPADFTTPSVSSIEARHPTISRQITTDSAKHLKFSVGKIFGPLELETTRARQHDSKEMMHLWARQNSTPSTVPASLATVTITRTTVVEVASETQVLVSTLFQTLTFVDPIVIIETSTITLSQPSVGVRKRHPRSTASDDNRREIATSESPITATEATSSSAPATVAALDRVAVPRQVSNEPITVISLVSVVTIETTVTLTRTGSFVSTATVVNPVVVSVTATPTVTTTQFVTTVAPVQTSTFSRHGIISSVRVSPTSTVASSTTASSSSPSQSVDTSFPFSTPDLTTTSATSSSIDPRIGVTTWFSWESDDFTPTTSNLTPTTTQTFTSSISSATTLPPPSKASAEPALDPTEIAGIALGATAAVILIILALWLLRRRSKRPQHVHIPEEDYQMTSATAAAAVINSTLSKPTMPHDRSVALASETSGISSHRDEVRIIIQPTTKSRTQSSGLFPDTKTWPRPPGYTGEAYSFSTEGSGQTIPQGPKTWSNASEYGGSSNREGLPGSGSRRMVAVHNGEKVTGASEANGNTS